MSKKYLIITSAHLSTNDNSEYYESVNAALGFSSYFDRVFLLECFSKKIEDLAYLKHLDIEIIISTIENYSQNKGINEFLHIESFLKINENIKEEDNIVKMTGRYILKTDDFLKRMPISKDILAKLDGNIWNSISGLSNRGVHTFYIIFRKKTISKFIDYLKDVGLLDTEDPIEWHLRDYMYASNSYELHDGQLGIETNFRGYGGWKILT